MLSSAQEVINCVVNKIDMILAHSVMIKSETGDIGKWKTRWCKVSEMTNQQTGPHSDLKPKSEQARPSSDVDAQVCSVIFDCSMH